MKEHPVIYSTEMIRAYLDGRKTMTRRVINPQPKYEYYEFDHLDVIGQAVFTDGTVARCPYGQVGDRLYCREYYHFYHRIGTQANVKYYADDLVTWVHIPKEAKTPRVGNHPSIHMPRWASRLTQTITEIRVERLQDIGYEDCKGEGIPQYTFAKGVLNENPLDGRWAFINLWDSINAKRGHPWAKNDWVWVISYPRYQDEPTAHPSASHHQV